LALLFEHLSALLPHVDFLLAVPFSKTDPRRARSTSAPLTFALALSSPRGRPPSRPISEGSTRLSQPRSGVKSYLGRRRAVVAGGQPHPPSRRGGVALTSTGSPRQLLFFVPVFSPGSRPSPTIFHRRGGAASTPTRPTRQQKFSNIGQTNEIKAENEASGLRRRPLRTLWLVPYR